MPVSKTAPPIEIWVKHEVKVTSERIPFDVDELTRTSLSNKPWKLYRVPADQIEPIESDWKQILSAPGIHVGEKSYITYRVAIDDSYIPWLSASQFKFQRDLDPLETVDEEVSIHGEWVAKRNAIARLHRDALKAISSGSSPGLDSCYRMVAKSPYREALEWTILKRDLALDPEVKIKFIQWLLFIALNLVDDYDTPLVLDLLRKNEDELLATLRGLYMNSSAYLPPKIDNFKAKDEFSEAQKAAEFHRISLFRFLLELAGGKRDVRQHYLDLEYTVNYNANVFGSMLGIGGSKPFGTFASQKMLDALSKSPVFPCDTIRNLDIMMLSAKLMRHLPIGFSDGYLHLPLDVLSKLSYGQVQIIRVQILNFYLNRRSLEMPKNNVLVLLTWNPTRHMADEVLIEWVASVDGRRLYEHIIKDIRGTQSKEQLVLTLAALLCYQQLLPPTSNTNQPIKGSYQADFDAILNGERLTNARTVFEYMVVSVLKVFYTVKGNEEIRTFLASALDIHPPVLDPFHEFSDQYWTCRINDRLDHKGALKIAETIVGPARSCEEKMVISEAAMIKEIATLDNEVEQEETPAFLGLAGIKNVESGRVQLDGYDFNSYTLVRVSDLGHCAKAGDELGSLDEILSIDELQDGSWELPVHNSYLPTLKDTLYKMVPDCLIEPDYDPTEPNPKEVEEFGYERARVLRTATFRERAERMIVEAWPKAIAFYADLTREIFNDDKEMDTLENKEGREMEEMVEESTDECLVLVEKCRL